MSGALLDRIDMYVDVQRVPLDALVHDHGGIEPSGRVRIRVERARARQRRRMVELQRRSGDPAPGATNACLPPAWLRHACRLDGALRELALQAAERMRLSARAWHRVLRVARTAADVEGVAGIHRRHLMEALQYRSPSGPDEQP